MMTERNPQPYQPNRTPDSVSLTRRGRLARTIAVSIIGGGAVLGTPGALHWAFDAESVGTKTVGLMPGDGGIATVCDAVAAIAEEKGIDPDAVYSCVYAGQQANRELTRDGRKPQPGDVLVVEVGKGRLGDYVVEAHEAESSAAS